MAMEKLTCDDPRVGTMKTHFPAPVHLERLTRSREVSRVGEVILNEGNTGPMPSSEEQTTSAE